MSDPFDIHMQFNYRFTDFLQRHGFLNVNRERLDKHLQNDGKFIEVTDWKDTPVIEDYDMKPITFKGV